MLRGERKDEGGQRFKASRLSPGNLIFPTVIEVTSKHVTRIKPSWVTCTEESISIRQVSSVTVKKGILWADITIHSSGGTSPLLSSGHTNADAEAIKDLIESYQNKAFQTGTTQEGELKQCPECAEWIKIAAVRCRFCGCRIEQAQEEGLPEETWRMR